MGPGASPFFQIRDRVGPCANIGDHGQNTLTFVTTQNQTAAFVKNPI